MFFMQISRAHGGMNFQTETLEEAFDRASIYNKDFPKEIVHINISTEPPVTEEDEFDFTDSTESLKEVTKPTFYEAMQNYPWTSEDDQK